MVYGIHPFFSGSASFCTWMHKTSKDYGSCMHPMDRLFMRSDSGGGSHEAGRKRNYFMSFKSYAAFYLLCSRLSNAALVSVHLPESSVESFQDGMLCIISADRAFTGMLCESGDNENVFKNAVRMI